MEQESFLHHFGERASILIKTDYLNADKNRKSIRSFAERTAHLLHSHPCRAEVGSFEIETYFFIFNTEKTVDFFTVEIKLIFKNLKSYWFILFLFISFLCRQI